MAKRVTGQGATGDLGKGSAAATARRRPPPVPSSSEPASGYLSVVTVETFARLIDATGLTPLPSLNLDAVMTKLDHLLVDFVLECEIDDVSNTADVVNWLRVTEDNAKAFLECFAVVEQGKDRVETAGYLLRGPKGYLEVEGTSPNPRHDVEVALNAMSILCTRLTAAREAYEALRTGKRPAAKLEFGLFQPLGEIYSDIFGLPWGISSDVEGRHTGPALRFCKAVGDLLNSQCPPPTIDTGRSPRRGERPLRAAIARLRSPDRAADRIREGIGGSVRKR